MATKKKRNYTPKSKEELAERAQREVEARAQVFIDALKDGNAPIGSPDSWDRNAATKLLPYNAKTGMTYRGGNSTTLQMALLSMIKQGLIEPENTDPRWMTYAQAAAAGCQVRKGAKGVCIYVLASNKKDAGKPTEEAQAKRDEKGLATEGTLVAIEDKRDAKRFVVPVHVFHASQIDGLPPMPPPREIPLDESLRAARELVEKSGAKVVYGHAKAAYAPGPDIIMMPPRELFISQADEVATLLHELAHWTGAKHRLGRPMEGKFGSPSYAREELVAEMASSSMAQMLGCSQLYDPSRHVDYIHSWIQRLGDHPAELMEASREVHRIIEFLDVPRPQYEPMPDVAKPEQKAKPDRPRGPGSRHEVPPPKNRDAGVELGL